MLRNACALFLLLFLTACGDQPVGADATEVPTATAPADTGVIGQLRPRTAEPNQQDIIYSDQFNGLRPGSSLSSNGNLRPGVLSDGEGDFDVFYLDNAAGDELGYAVPSPNNERVIGSLVITSPEVATAEGIRVGSSFADLRRRFGRVEVHGSEIEGRTYATVNGLDYRLDAANFSYALDPETIDPATEIVAIRIANR